MARLSAELALTLRDGVSGPARKVGNSLNELERKVRSQAGIAGGIGAANAAAMARVGSVLAPAALGYAAKAAVTRYASVERAINRIGVTAGATADETRAAFGAIDKAAYDYAISQDQVTEGLDSLVSAGRSMKEAMAFLPSVVATAQASGAEIKDIATTADAVGTGFDIAGNKMQDAFDILVTGGKLGKFELKDMAQYLPALVPAFEALGYKGETGLKKITAALQVVRAGTGSAGEAATAFQNVIQKMESEETAKRFKSFGIDLRKEMTKARREGRDLLDVFIELSQKAVGGDLSKLPQLFADSQMQAGMRALLNGVPQLAGYVRELGNAAGSTQKDLARILADPQAKIEKMSASWDRLVKAVGGGIAPAAGTAMDAISGVIDNEAAISAANERLKAEGIDADKAYDRYIKRFEDRYGKKGGRYSRTIGEAYREDLAAYGRGEIGSPLERVLSNDAPDEYAGPSAPKPISLSDEPLRRGLPVPTARPDSVPAALATEASIDRLRDEIAARDKRIAIGRTGQQIMRGPTSADIIAPSTNASQAIGTQRMLEVQRRISDAAMGRSFPERRTKDDYVAPPSGRDALSGIVSRIDAAAQVKQEGDRAALEAEAAGQRIQSGLSVTATPQVNTQPIEAATSAVDRLLGKLAQVGPATQRANAAAAEMVMQSGRTSRVNYDGLMADTTHTGF